MVKCIAIDDEPLALAHDIGYISSGFWEMPIRIPLKHAINCMDHGSF